MPCYHDATCLKRLIPEILSIDATYRVLVVNDTALPDPVLEALQQEHPFEICTVPYNLGHQGAIVYGMVCALLNPQFDDIDFFVTMDSDGQDDPSAIPMMISRAGEKSVCVAQRKGERPEGFKFSLGYAIHKFLFKFAVGFTPDYGNYAVMSRSLARQVAISPEFDAVYSFALHYLAPLTKYPLKRRPRFDGKSKVQFHGLIDHSLAAILANLKTIAQRLAFLSLAISMLLVLVSILIAIAKFVLPPAYVAPNWATTICFSSAILGLQFFSLCVILFVLAAGIRQSSYSQRLMTRILFAETQLQKRDKSTSSDVASIIAKLY